LPIVSLNGYATLVASARLWSHLQWIENNILLHLKAEKCARKRQKRTCLNCGPSLSGLTVETKPHPSNCLCTDRAPACIKVGLTYSGLWSIGSWGGSGLCSLFGGLVTQNLGWRYIFFASVLVAVIGLILIHDTPESRAEGKGDYKFDFAGVIAFMIAMVALQIVVTQGNRLGWTSVYAIALIAVTVIFGILFFRVEARASSAFVDFGLFKNPTFSGATISNFLLNGVTGTQIVSLQLVQLGGKMSAQQAGLLTLGYAVAIIAFIRVGEKLLQRFGARKPMIWGCLITGVSILLISATNVMLSNYKILAVIGYTLFGVGLAFYATPSTDAALSNLPETQAGSGSGIYKMASSLGAAFGVAISAAIFTALSADAGSVNWLEGVITFQGRQDNLALREAAIIALMVNVLMAVVAIITIMLTVPKGKEKL
jgi:DHA2 family multidrug resistance protein-like MFS transporter